MTATPEARPLLARAAGFLLASEGGLRHRVLRSGIWVGFSSIVQNVLQTARSIVLANLLTPQIFGLMALSSVVIRGLDLLTETGIGPALIHRQHDVEKAKNTAFTLQILRGLLLAVMAAGIAPLAAAYYEEPALRGIILWLAAGFAIGGFVNTDIVLFQKKLDFRRLTVMDLSVSISSTVVIIALAAWMRSVWALVYGQIATSILRLVLSYVMVPTRPSLSFDRQTALELFRYGRFITGLTIVLFLTTELDNMVVGKVLGFENLGLYALAYTLANLPATHISKVVSTVVFPAYSTLQNNMAAMRSAYLTVLRLSGGITIPAAAGLALLAPEIVQVVYGQQWLPMVGALRILAVFGAMRALSILGGSVFNAIGRPNISFYLITVKLMAILAVIYPMTVRYGIEGAALAVTIPQFIGDVVALFILRRQIGLEPAAIVKILGRVMASTLGMCLVVAGLRHLLAPITTIDLLLLIVTGALTYAALSLQELRELYTQQFGRSRSEPTVTAAS